MQINHLHDWNLSFPEAAELQRHLAANLDLCSFKRPLQTVAGIDCAFSRDKQYIFACIVVVQFGSFDIIETAHAIEKVTFPYVPGFLSFREAPACVAAAEKLRINPDCIIVDGQGVAHPRKLGLAAHLGLFWDIPTIGCAKSRLIGRFTEPALKKGSQTPLKYKDKIIGAVLRTRTNVKPVFVSPGNKCLLEDAVRITLDCSVKYRLPEPTRLAHNIVNQIKSSNL